MSKRTQVLQSYRQLLQIQRIAFAYDIPLQHQAKQQIRDNYIKHKQADAKQVNKLLQDAADAYNFLKHNVIQIKKKSENAYEARLRPEHTTTDTKSPPELM